jgi:hypothetical protein
MLSAQKATKREADAWGYNGVTLSLGDTNTETWASRLGVARKADDLAPLKKKFCENQRSENRMKSGRIF